MWCINRLHSFLGVGFCHVHVKDNGEQGDRVDVVSQTSTAKLTVTNNNQTILSATMKILPTLATHEVFGMPLLRPHRVNALVKG